SVFIPIAPPSASISRTMWPFPKPPIAGLQDIWPIVSRFCVSMRVWQPNRAAAKAASIPACPLPITITSYSLGNLYIRIQNPLCRVRQQIAKRKSLARSSHCRGHNIKFRGELCEYLAARTARSRRADGVRYNSQHPKPPAATRDGLRHGRPLRTNRKTKGNIFDITSDEHPARVGPQSRTH